MSDEYLDEIVSKIEDVEEHEMQLTDWERHFIDNMNAVLGAGGHITLKQAEKLNEIWERVT